MKPRFHNVFAASLLIIAIGGHLVILQCAAWMGMLVSYSHKDGITIAIGKTFDGKHPCNLCKLVSKNRSAEGNQKFVKSSIKIDWMLIEKGTFSWNANWIGIEPSPNDGGHLKSLVPPTPPPKLV